MNKSFNFASICLLLVGQFPIAISKITATNLASCHRVTGSSCLLSVTNLKENDLNFLSQARTNQPQNTQTCRQELAREIDRIIDRPQSKQSYWGIVIQNLETEETAYSLNEDKFFVPASTAKLLTTAAALNELGADYRLTTPIYATGELPHLDTVRIQGKGDPTITSEILENIVQQFKVLGIKSIKKLIVDDSYFARPLVNPTWEWVDTYYYYATAVNGAILNENTVSLTLVPQEIGQPVKLKWEDSIAARQWQVFNRGVTALPNTEYTIEIDGVLGKPVLNIRGKLPQDNQKDTWDLAIVDPANYFLETWRNLLSTEGIKVDRGIVIEKVSSFPSERIITQMYSPPLSQLITETNRESNNLYAEVILKTLAKELKTEKAIDALETSLTKLKIEPNSYHLLDGSGLSRHNLIMPQTLVKVLTIMANQPVANSYRASLAIAGNNGTLKHRLRNTILQNNIWGKTGGLSGVITFAGYLQLPNNKNLVVSILINNFNDKNRIARQAMDEIFLLLPKYPNCF